MTARETNWAGNIVYRAARVARPRSVGEAQELVASSGQVRAVGSGHSFNRIADAPGVLISLADLPPVIDIDHDRAAVTLTGGTSYRELTQRLNAAGYALPSMASLPHLTVAGAVATATHGSGDANGNLATPVSGLELITADGAVRTLRRGTGGEEFRAASSGSWSATRTGGGRPRGGWTRRWPAGRSTRSRAATPAMPPGSSGRRGHGTSGCPISGPGSRRAAGGAAIGVPRAPGQVAAGAFDALATLGGLMAPVLQISEIRTVAPDDLWLSTSFQRDTVALHFTWIKDISAVTPVIAAMEQLLTPLGARPHWAKVFGMPPHVVRALYPRSADFQDLLGGYDPDGKFRNGFIDRYFPAGHSAHLARP